MCTSYLDIIKFCESLTINQLIEFKDFHKPFKNKEYLVALEVLTIRLNKNNNNE